jgi:hypothetical protein
MNHDLSVARKKRGNGGQKAAPLYSNLSADFVKQLKSIIGTDIMIAMT